MAMIWKVLTRKKVIDPVSAEQSQLSRVLNTFDLTALGVGSTLGVGVYVLAGHVARDIAGPAVILSFLLAAIASVFAGLCYAEFGARAPRAGSAYIYSYVCIGEFIAFVIGWNLILEYVIGSASVARGLSLYLDTLINNTLKDTFREIAPINVPHLSQYFDFFAFGISILLATALAFGLKESSLVNNIFTVINIFVVGFVIIAGSLKADPGNWSISPDKNDTNATGIGNGGFFPFGVEGMIRGAATCFYGFVGFDCIATTAEEVKNPKRAIPISIILSLFIIFLAYFGTSTVITLMVPYYLQNPDAPIPYAFEHIGWYTAKWIVSIGGIFGLCASLFGAMFPLPRIVYAMASDSLVFKFLGKVHSRFQTPVIGTLLAGLLTGLMAALFDLSQLVNMMSIGTLLAYTIVAASVLLLRYTREETHQYVPVQTTSDSDDSENYTENKTYNNSEDATTSDEQELLHPPGGSVLAQIFNCGRYKNPTKTSETIVAFEVFIYCIICVLMGLCAIYLRDYIGNGEIWAIVITSIVVFIAVVIIMSIVTQPTSNKELSFKVPLVPLIPALSILVNIYLMLMLDIHTWIRFAVWMAIGLPIYYFSVRPYTEAQNKNVSNKSSIDYNVTMVHNKQNGKINGINNKAFVDDENVSPQLGVENENKNSKKKAAPQPPMQTNGILENEIPAEITRLDEILDAAASSIDDSVIERFSMYGFYGLPNSIKNFSDYERLD
ncbi:high affinity cationic amino acid transporter 1 isoform X1 [Anoplophora glabripennis]|uniref:high affinity cationic amino acid transporter 1 isoform X1 n=1 Tax=Anoplophora glabripennis TaxID=217634 RepID=UPI0008759F17|nr:high affinity cationic amino acid transporter 1 isoform X1 [Anoplophora glabripennis]